MIDCSRLILVCAAAVTLVVVEGCDHHTAKDSASAPAGLTATAVPHEVVIARAAYEAWPRTVRVQGSLLPYEEAVIGSKQAGRVEAVAVDLGSVVKAGEPLLMLERSELELRVALAEAQLRQASAAIGLTPDQDEGKFKYTQAPAVMLEAALVNEAQAAVNRARGLLPARAITEGEYDTLVAQLKAAQARYGAALNTVNEQVSLIRVRREELAIAREQLAHTRIVAPFDGIIGERRVAPGEYVQVGQAVVTLVRADRLRYTAGVPEKSAATIRIGQRIEIDVAGANGPVVAAISRTSPMVMAASRAVLVEADVANESLALQPGLFAEAEIVVDERTQALVVPASAVSRFAGVEKVWVVVDDAARQQTVRTGREENGRVEILEGIGAGDAIVRDAAAGRDGPVVADEPASDRPVGAKLQALVPDETSGEAL